MLILGSTVSEVLCYITSLHYSEPQLELHYIILTTSLCLNALRCRYLVAWLEMCNNEELNGWPNAVATGQ